MIRLKTIKSDLIKSLLEHKFLLKQKASHLYNTIHILVHG